MENKRKFVEKVDSKENSFYLFGIHPVREAIRKKMIFSRLYLQKSLPAQLDHTAKENQNLLIDYCRKNKIQFRFVERLELDLKLKHQNHQGVVAELKRGTRIIADLDLFVKGLDHADCFSMDPPQEHEQEKLKIILMVDRVTDQQNMGAIARSAYYFGCRLIIAENHHSAPVDSVVHKTSSGASLLIPFHYCDKLSQAIDLMQARGYRVVSTSTDPESVQLKDFIRSKIIQEDSKVVVLVGAEGGGVRPHLARKADSTITIRRENDFDSLNVSVATGIILYEMTSRLDSKIDLK